MKYCTKCGAQVQDNAVFCTKCGSRMEQQETETGQDKVENSTGNPYYGSPIPADPYDHTAEFTRKDVSDNKVIAMLVYLLGTTGIIIALLASSTSPYAAFHVRQALKFTVLNILAGLAAVLFFWTFIIPMAALLFIVILGICRIIAFFSICKGNSKEPYIVRNFNFLK